MIYTQVYQDTRPLKVGILHDNKIYPAMPACTRGVDLAAEALKKQGHTVSISLSKGLLFWGAFHKPYV